MIIVFSPDATDGQIAAVEEQIKSLRLGAHVVAGVERKVISVIGVTDDKDLLIAQFSQLDGVDQVIPISHSYKLVSREAKSTPTVVRITNRAAVGGEQLAICAGPCSVESREQIFTTAEHIAAAGANLLRGGAYKPRTSPYAFQGLGVEGLKYLREAADQYDLGVVTEVLDVRDVEAVAQYADLLQIGARNMQNFGLLRAVGQIRKPVLLKRGISATIEEWLMAAEYVFIGGNHDVVLCERGIRSYDPSTRNILDLSAVPVLRHLTHLPILVDPSHGTGVRQLVAPMALAAVAVGADGLLIEVHPNPAKAFSDGPQSLTFPLFDELMRRIAPVAAAVDRSLPTRPVAA
ncbi:MAG TPA: 3-deoxy-7-phosphoheptulonate synthase [Candidatus Baltobacteraceae bacterium]|jgi:3-deoxy-7-phosphoheptulonate synthase|nr:3-deoxy-7-phosphoheptulonate synthase [Candidatus Baltobacteraceae bacterium]